MPVKAPGVLPFNWGGLYAGLNLGGGFSDVSGVVFGGQLGYNWQMGRLVFGVETDIQYSGQDDTTTILGTPVKQELDWFGTFRGRLGYTMWDRWLPYVTGGLAYGSRTVKVPAFGFSADDTSVGWAFGVGVDYAINQAWSARLEYLHISLDSFTPVFAGTAVSVGRLDNDIIRGAVNYKLSAY
jgi:outer membrane immunogenic protein